jgi:hypothetical protein
MQLLPSCGCASVKWCLGRWWVASKQKDVMEGCMAGQQEGLRMTQPVCLATTAAPELTQHVEQMM